ncbi:MAG TPA: hypothetical protein VHC95_06915 [Opitutales bacterium]|nr:hypothetical protein [Opitutales bacterium]
MSQNSAIASSVEEVRNYILDCLRFQQRASRSREIREAAFQFEEIIKTAKVDPAQEVLPLGRTGTEGSSS